MQRKRFVAMLSAGWLAATVTAVAHHAFTAEFDANRPVKLEGTVTRIEWINPHAWIHMSVKNPKTGQNVVWMIEGGTPNTLLRRGITRESLKPGAVILVDGYQAKNGSNKANGRNLTLPGGQKLFLGSSGTGAPKDGNDPNEKK